MHMNGMMNTRTSGALSAPCLQTVSSKTAILLPIGDYPGAYATLC